MADGEIDADSSNDFEAVNSSGEYLYKRFVRQPPFRLSISSIGSSELEGLAESADKSEGYTNPGSHDELLDILSLGQMNSRTSVAPIGRIFACDYEHDDAQTCIGIDLFVSKEVVQYAWNQFSGAVRENVFVELRSPDFSLEYDGYMTRWNVGSAFHSPISGAIFFTRLLPSTISSTRSK